MGIWRSPTWMARRSCSTTAEIPSWCACVYCGTGHFESSKISSLSDLGYALSAWRPLHEDCEDYSSEEFPDF